MEDRPGFTVATGDGRKREEDNNVKIARLIDFRLGRHRATNLTAETVTRDGS
jgi:hypothetical protein